MITTVFLARLSSGRAREMASYVSLCQVAVGQGKGCCFFWLMELQKVRCRSDSDGDHNDGLINLKKMLVIAEVLSFEPRVRVDTGKRLQM